MNELECVSASNNALTRKASLPLKVLLVELELHNARVVFLSKTEDTRYVNSLFSTITNASITWLSMVELLTLCIFPPICLTNVKCGPRIADMCDVKKRCTFQILHSFDEREHRNTVQRFLGESCVTSQNWGMKPNHRSADYLCGALVWRRSESLAK